MKNILVACATDYKNSYEYVTSILGLDPSEQYSFYLFDPGYNEDPNQKQEILESKNISVKRFKCLLNNFYEIPEVCDVKFDVIINERCEVMITYSHEIIYDPIFCRIIKDNLINNGYYISPAYEQKIFFNDIIYDSKNEDTFDWSIEREIDIDEYFKNHKLGLEFYKKIKFDNKNSSIHWETKIHKKTSKSGGSKFVNFILY